MKKFLSILLACVLVLPCVVVLSSCDNIDWQGFGIEDYDDDDDDDDDDNDNDDNDSKKSKKEPIEVLKDYLKKNGKIHGYEQYGYSSDEYYFYEIVYDEKKDDIKFYGILLEDSDEKDLKEGNYSYNDIQRLTTIYLDYKSKYSKVSWIFLLTDNTTYIGDANIDKSVFSKSNDTLYDIDLTGLLSYSHYDVTLSLFKGDVSKTLQYVAELLKKANLKVDLSDLGYSNY